MDKVEPKTEFGRDLAEMMQGWDTIMAEAKRQFPNASEEEQYQIAKGAFTHALGLDKLGV